MYSLNKVRKAFKKLEIQLDPKKIIHITGTNGKGTTANLISFFLQKAGYRVALYTSPHLLELNERIRINGKPIKKEFLEEKINKLNVFSLSFFEKMTLSAFLIFSELELDYIVLEVGLGGRLDATNIVNTAYAVLTSVGLDHTEILGNNIDEIAEEKLGIAKKNQLFISGVYSDIIYDKLSKTVAEQQFYSKDFYLEDNKLVFKDKELNIINIPYFLDIPEQRKNLALASYMAYKIVGLEYFDLKEFKLQAHLERFKYKNKTIYIDTAHNFDAIKAVLEFLGKNNKSNIVVFLSILRDKDLEKITNYLNAYKYFIIPSYSFEKERGYRLDELKVYGKRLLKSFTDAFKYINKAKEKEFLFIGSHYYYRELLSYLQGF